MSDENKPHMSYQDRPHAYISWLSLGFIIFFGAFYLLWWNEEQSLHRAEFLTQERQTTKSIASTNINPQNNNSLVHITGVATSNEKLTDNIFGVSLQALQLERVVMMYQWNQTSNTTKKNNQAYTTYRYNKGWYSYFIDSNNFIRLNGHENPKTMPYKGTTITASKIIIGDFILSPTFVDQITNSSRYTLTQANLNAITPFLKKYFQLTNNEFFYGTPNNPQIGDIKIYFNVTNPVEVSVIGKQKNNTLVEFYSKLGHLNMLELGKVSANKMFPDYQLY